jgi:hypothetical protein
VEEVVVSLRKYLGICLGNQGKITKTPVRLAAARSRFELGKSLIKSEALLTKATC